MSNPYSAMRNAIDLMEVAEETEEENLTWKELADLLGVKPKENGNLDGGNYLTRVCIYKATLLFRICPQKRGLRRLGVQLRS